MPQHIGNAGAKAMGWGRGVMLSLSPQVERGKERDKFTERYRSLFDPGPPLEVSIRRQMETFLGRDLEKVRIHHGYQAGVVSRRLGARAFTIKGQDSGHRQNLDTATTQGLGLLAHELTHVTQQTQPQRLPQVANRGYSPVPAALTRTPSDAGMVLPAPAEDTPLTTRPARRAPARASELPGAQGSARKRSESASGIDVEKVADRVYQLMQHDLNLERERATKLGG